MPVTSVVAVIPARGGSKGLPRKNLAPLAGKTLLAHAIASAIESPSISQTFVSTEDEIIAKEARACGASVINRPEALAGDEIETRAVVEHAHKVLRASGDGGDAFALLSPTCPLRSARHVTECIEAFLNSGAVSGVAVTEENHPPHKSLTIQGNRLSPLLGWQSLGVNRQTLPQTYRQNGAIWVLRWEDFLRSGSFVVDPAVPYLMPRDRSVDIDTAIDLAFAELLLQRSLNKLETTEQR